MISRDRGQKVNKKKSVSESNNSSDLYRILVMKLKIKCLKGIEMSNTLAFVFGGSDFMSYLVQWIMVISRRASMRQILPPTMAAVDAILCAGSHFQLNE